MPSTLAYAVLPVTSVPTIFEGKSRSDAAADRPSHDAGHANPAIVVPDHYVGDARVPASQQLIAQAGALVSLTFALCVGLVLLLRGWRWTR